MVSVACIQTFPKYRDLAANLAEIELQAKSIDADILIFPELALTGYFFQSSEEMESLAATTGGALAESLSRIARENSTAIITGFLEAANGKHYNSALAFDATGKLVGHYRKVHRFYYETQIFEQGDLGFPVFDLATRGGHVRTGMLVCYDWRFPEAARSLALQGAELIAMPSNIVTTTGMLHTTLQTRAFENKVALAFADRVGTETLGGETLTFRGESAIINYNGEIIAKASPDKPEAIIAELDLTKTRDKRFNQFNDLLEDRVPAAYLS